MAGLLSNYRLLDLSGHHGSACSAFFASMGAEVICINAVDGEKDHFPFDRRGKKSITLDIHQDKGKALFTALIKQCDFFLEACSPGYLDALGIGYSDLEKINPRLIHISITPFGQTGPYAQFTGGELVGSAMGGTLATCGYPDDTPVLEALDACCFHANSVAAMGAMLAHRERGLSNKGQHIDCSIQEVAASRNTTNLLCWQFDRRTLERAGDRVRFGAATVRVVWELADGYCFHSIMTGKFGAPANSALSQWMTDEGFENPMADVDWDKYDRSALPAETRLVWEAAIDKFFKSKTKQDINSEGRIRGIRATVANAPEDVVADEHLQSRQFLSAVESEEQQTILHPDYFVRLSHADFRLSKSLPQTGADNDDVFHKLLGLSQQDIETCKQSGII